MTLKRFFFAIFALMALALGVTAQSRGPQLVVPNYQKIPAPAERDTSGYDERPYFILIDQSEKALAENDYEAAALRLVEAMGVEPDNPLNVALMSNLGMIYFYDGKDSLALKCLDEVVRRSPGLIAGHENRGQVLAAIGRDKEAYAEYGTVISLDSLNTNSRFYHGMMALYMGDLNTAGDDFAILESVVPLARTTNLAMGTLYALTSREAEAIPYLRKLVDIDPQAEYSSMLAQCYLVTDRLAEASDVLAKAIDRYPSEPQLYLLRARLHRARYEMDAAAADEALARKLQTGR